MKDSIFRSVFIMFFLCFSVSGVARDIFKSSVLESNNPTKPDSPKPDFVELAYNDLNSANATHKDFGPEGAFMPLNNSSGGEFDLLDGNRNHRGNYNPYKNQNRDSIKRGYDESDYSRKNNNGTGGTGKNDNDTLSSQRANQNSTGNAGGGKTYYRDKNGRLILTALTPIYFDFDKYSIRADMQEFIRANADFIRSRNIKSVTLQGNTDEVGTDEYNMALGHKRALSVRDSLVVYGLPRDMFSTISYGVHNPVCLDSTKQCHAKNRRTEIIEKK